MSLLWAILSQAWNGLLRHFQLGQKCHFLVFYFQTCKGFAIIEKPQVISLALASHRERTQVNCTSGSRVTAIQRGQLSKNFSKFVENAGLCQTLISQAWSRALKTVQKPMDSFKNSRKNLLNSEYVFNSRPYLSTWTPPHSIVNNCAFIFVIFR